MAYLGLFLGGGGCEFGGHAHLCPNFNFLLLIFTYPLGGGYVLFSPLFLTALSLSLSLSFHTFFLE